MVLPLQLVLQLKAVRIDPLLWQRIYACERGEKSQSVCEAQQLQCACAASKHQQARAPRQALPTC